MDRQSLEHSLVRRLLAHIDRGTTDMAEDCLEIPSETYTSEERHIEELNALFLGHPIVLCMSGALPRPGSYLAIELCGPRVRALQLVHADDRGQWPWDRWYRGVRGGQPVLGPRAPEDQRRLIA